MAASPAGYGLWSTKTVTAIEERDMYLNDRGRLARMVAAELDDLDDEPQPEPESSDDE